MKSTLRFESSVNADRLRWFRRVARRLLRKRWLLKFLILVLKIIKMVKELSSD